jgi:pilus assembly protein CpaF
MTKKKTVKHSKAIQKLEALVGDPTVTEIFVDSSESIHYLKDGKSIQAEFSFSSGNELSAVIAKYLKQVGRKVSPGQPFINVRLKDGTTFTAVTPPLAMGSPVLVFKKMPTRTLDWEGLVKFGAVDQAIKGVLERIMAGNNSLLVCGNRNSGKSTVAGVLVDSIPADRRIVSVEQDFNLMLTHKRCVRLEGAPVQGLDFGVVIQRAHMLEPEWLVVSELCGNEALDVLNTMRAGINVLGVLHADSALDALSRMELMCLSANPSLGLHDIRAMIGSNVHYVSFQRRCRDGVRRITEIVEVQGVSDNRYQLQPIVRYDEETGRFELSRPSSRA